LPGEPTRRPPGEVARDGHHLSTDYARQVFEPRSWRQPARQVFLLHRDRRATPRTNLPRYFQGQAIEPDTVILGAVPCVPEQVNTIPDGLARVLDRFLETYAGL
jgi:hypothetical protein